MNILDTIINAEDGAAVRNSDRNSDSARSADRSRSPP